MNGVAIALIATMALGLIISTVTDRRLYKGEDAADDAAYFKYHGVKTEIDDLRRHVAELKDRLDAPGPPDDHDDQGKSTGESGSSGVT